MNMLIGLGCVPTTTNCITAAVRVVCLEYSGSLPGVVTFGGHEMYKADV